MKITLKSVCSNVFNNYQNILTEIEKIHVGGYPINGDETSKIIAIATLKKIVISSQISQEHKNQIQEVLMEEKALS